MIFLRACLLFGAKGARQVFTILRRLIAEEILPMPQVLCDLYTLNKLLGNDEKIDFFFGLYIVRCGSLRKFYSLIYSESKFIKNHFIQLIEKIKKVDWLKEDLDSLGSHFEILAHKTKHKIENSK